MSVLTPVIWQLLGPWFDIQPLANNDWTSHRVSVSVSSPVHAPATWTLDVDAIKSCVHHIGQQECPVPCTVHNSSGELVELGLRANVRPPSANAANAHPASPPTWTLCIEQESLGDHAGVDDTDDPCMADRCAGVVVRGGVVNPRHIRCWQEVAISEDGTRVPLTLLRHQTKCLGTCHFLILVLI